jgi:hypothetical protein
MFPTNIGRTCFLTIYGLGDVVAQLTEKYIGQTNKVEKKSSYDYARTLKQSLFGLLFGRYFFPLAHLEPPILPFSPRLNNLYIRNWFLLPNLIFSATYFMYWGIINNIDKTFLYRILLDKSIYQHITWGFLANIFAFPITFIISRLLTRYTTFKRAAMFLLIPHTALLSWLQYNNFSFTIEIGFK